MPEELAQGIRDGMMEKQLDGIVFDACQMSCMEVAQAVAPYGQYMVASQELSAGAGLRYDRWLGELSKDPGMDSRALYTLMVKSYLDEYRKNPFEYTCTMSVLELAHAQAFSQAAEQLYRALDEHLSKTPDEVLNRRAMLTSFGEFDGSDATDFVDALRVTEVFADLVPEACAQMWAALSELVVYSEAAQSFQGNANGISITMPYATLPWLYEITDYYGSLRGDSAYVRFVMDMAAEVEKRYIIVENEKPDFLPKEEMWAGLLDDAA